VRTNRTAAIRWWLQRGFSRAKRRTNSRTSPPIRGTAAPIRVRPAAGDEPAVPAQQRRRCHHEQAATRAWQQPTRCSQEDPLARPWCGRPGWRRSIASSCRSTAISSSLKPFKRGRNVGLGYIQAATTTLAAHLRHRFRRWLRDRRVRQDRRPAPHQTQRSGQMPVLGSYPSRCLLRDRACGTAKSPRGGVELDSTLTARSRALGGEGQGRREGGPLGDSQHTS
jgi:hypothetical protein